MSDSPLKRRLFIVGGKGKNVPRWLSEAFDYEQFDQENAKTRTLEPSVPPDAIVCLKSWVGHEHWYGARDLSQRLSVPLINAPGGWSTSLKAAADLGVEWYVQAVERARRSDDLTEDEAEEAEEFIDNAWREAYEREYEARQALEKRLRKDRTKFEQVQLELERLKKRETASAAAAKRVLAEVRLAAARQRAASAEIQERSERVSEALIHHISSLKELFDSAEAGHAAVLKASSRLGDTRRIAQAKTDALRAAMTIAEDGLAMIRQISPSPDHVSASNAGTDS